MSNLINIFGSSEGAMGPANIYYDAPIETGDTGDNIFLGATKGLKIMDKITKGDLVGDQYGTTAFNRVVTGEEVTLEGSLVEMTLERLQAVLQGFVSFNTGAQGAARAQSLGQDDLTYKAKPLKIVRVIGGAESADNDDILILPVASPVIEAEFAYDAATQRELKIKFNCYLSRKYTLATTGKRVFYFTMSALANAHINVGSGDLL